MINKNDVTIVIPTLANERNEFALKECLLSLYESDFPMDHIIVAYNGVFGGFGVQDVKTIWVEEQGQCKAVNATVATVNTHWVMVSNDDMIYPKDWFERLTDFDENEIWCISPVLVEPRPGAPTFIVYPCGGVGGDWDKEKFMEFAQKYEGSGLRSGFNLPFLVKKEVWDLVGGYDVNFDPFSSNSDSDLEYKFKLAGVKMYQNTNCPVYHFSNTSDTFLPENRSYWEKNWNYFIEKWGFPRTDDGIWEATFEIPMDKLRFHPFWEGFYSRKNNN